MIEPEVHEEAAVGEFPRFYEDFSYTNRICFGNGRIGALFSPSLRITGARDGSSAPQS